MKRTNMVSGIALVLLAFGCGPDNTGTSGPTPDLNCGALADADAKRRLATASQLRGVHAPHSVPVIIARFAVEPESDVRRALCEALAATATHDAARGLATALADRDAAVRSRARTLLEALYRRELPADAGAAHRLVDQTPPP